MRFSTIKPVIIGVSAAAAVIAITGAASGSGVGAVFNLGKTNTVNAPSSLTGSTKHPLLSLDNSGAGTALSLAVGAGEAPFSVNSSTQVHDLNASLLGGLAPGEFVQGGGESRAFGFTMSTASDGERKLLSVPGFGTLSALCGPEGSGHAEVMFRTGDQSMDKLLTAITSSSVTTVTDSQLNPNASSVFTGLFASGVNGVWQRQLLRYETSAGLKLTEHIASIELTVVVNSNTCDFDASASIGPGVTGP